MPAGRSALVGAQCFHIELALVAERIVEALAPDPHRVLEVVRRCRGEAFRPENVNRLLESSIPIKFTWSRHGLQMDVMDRSVNNVYASFVPAFRRDHALPSEKPAPANANSQRITSLFLSSER